MKGLFKDAFTVLFARGFIRLAQLMSFVLLARFLTPAEFGWFGLVTTGIALGATIGSLGLRQSSAYQIGRNLITAGEATGTILAVWLPLAAITTLVSLYVFSWDLPGVSNTVINTAIFVGVASTMLIMMLQGVLLGRGEIRSFSTTETLPRVVLTTLAVVLAVTGLASASNAIWSQAISFAVIVPLAIVLARRNAHPLRIRFERLPSLVTYGIAFALNLFLITLCARISMFVIERVSDASNAGRFFAAVRVSDIALEAAAALGLVVFSRSVQTTDTTEVVSQTARIACWMFWSFGIGGIVIAVLAPWMVTLVLGAEYSGSGDALRILAMGLPAAAANKVIYPGIAGQGRPWFGTLIITLSLSANLIAALLLVPLLGIQGGAIALVIGQYIMLLGYIVTCRAVFGIRAHYFFVPQRDDATRTLDAISRKIPRLRRS